MMPSRNEVLVQAQEEQQDKQLVVVVAFRNSLQQTNSSMGVVCLCIYSFMKDNFL
jgi:hypothetical protein